METSFGIVASAEFVIILLLKYLGLALQIHPV